MKELSDHMMQAEAAKAPVVVQSIDHRLEQLPGGVLAKERSALGCADGASADYPRHTHWMIA